MKIAVASEGREPSSSISLRAGRAPYYLIFEDGKLVKVLENPFRFGGGGAGYGVAQMLYEEGVKLVIAGQFGPNMLAALREKGMNHKEVIGKKVEEVI